MYSMYMIENRLGPIKQVYRRLIPLPIKQLVMFRIRDFQRRKFIQLQASADATANRLRIAMNANGYRENLGGSDPFMILMMCKYADHELLNLNISWLNRLYEKATPLITILIDDDKRWANVKSLNKSNKAIIFEYEGVYDGQLTKYLPEIMKYRPIRRNWIRQQILKTLFVMEQDIPVVILDADTFLLKKFEFVKGSTQILFAGPDFHSSYAKHIRKFLEIEPTALSFVHHCQVQFSKILSEIYMTHPKRNLHNWLKLGDKLGEYSAVSEFQTYGDFVLHNHPETARVYFHEHLEVSLLDHKFQDLSELLEKLSMEKTFDLITITNKEMIDAERKE